MQEEPVINVADQKSENALNEGNINVYGGPGEKETTPINANQVNPQGPTQQSPPLAGMATTAQQTNAYWSVFSSKKIPVPTSVLTYSPGLLPIPNGIPLEVPPYETNPMESSDLFQLPNFYQGYRENNPPGLPLDPTTILNDLDSIVIVPGNSDIFNYDYDHSAESWQILSPNPEQNNNPNAYPNHLFTCVKHTRAGGLRNSGGCTCCDKPDYLEHYLHQLDYKVKNKNFASFYLPVRKTCCCCSSCQEMCDKYEFIGVGRVGKYPLEEYWRLSRPLGFTAVPTSCGKKYCGSGAPDSIDYIDLGLNTKYRLAAPQYNTKCDCCGACCGIFFCCCAICLSCCPRNNNGPQNIDEKYRALDDFATIVNMQTKQITGYVVRKKGGPASYQKIYGCCGGAKETYINYSGTLHYTIFFPKEANSIDKFMIMNMVMFWSSYYGGHIYESVQSTISVEDLEAINNPNMEELSLINAEHERENA